MGNPVAVRFSPGLIEEAHTEVVLRLLGALPAGAVVAYLGSGGNSQGQVDWLARALAERRKSDARLFVVDCRSDWLERARTAYRSTYLPSTSVEFVVGDAGRLDQIALPAADLILALGLFGDLVFEGRRSLALEDPGFAAAALGVLTSSARMLRPGGHLLVSNSEVRQPRASFMRLVERAALHVVTESPEARESPGSRASSAEGRYLLVLANRRRP